MNVANKLIEKLIELKESNSIEGYSHIKNILKNQFIPVYFTDYQPYRLARYRRHRIGEDFFLTSKQLSYRKDILNIKSFGRANEPGQGLFYCNDNENEDIGVAEIVSVLRDNPNSQEEIITTSAWDVIDKIKLAVILPTEENIGIITELDNGKKHFNNFEQSSNFDELKIFNEFLSKEFTLDLNLHSSNYMITSAFSNYIKENFEVDGLMYASVKAEYKGLNIVLWPESVDKKVKFSAARKSIYKRFQGNKFVEVQTFDSKHYDKTNDIINW